MPSMAGSASRIARLLLPAASRFTSRVRPVATSASSTVLEDVPAHHDTDSSLSKLCNIGISAHIDSGETTLTERVLFYTGPIHGGDMEVDAVVGKPQVDFREERANFDYLHRKQSGGQGQDEGQDGRVVGYIDPLPENYGKKLEFENQMVGQALPSSYLPAIEKGFFEGCSWRKGLIVGTKQDGDDAVVTAYVAKTAEQETRISEGMMLARSQHHIPAFFTPSQSQNGDLLEHSRPLLRRFEHRLWGSQQQSGALQDLVGGRRQFCSAAAAKQAAAKKMRNSVPVRSLVQPLPKKAGRNHSGQITIRHRGGGHKRAYRIIDFRRQDKDGVQATVSGIEYDPNRSARIALLDYTDGVKSYILAARGLVAGDEVAAGPDADIRPGNALPLSSIPVGTTVHAIELRPGGGAQLARSAGSGAQLMRKEGKLAQLRLPSSEVRNVDVRCRATVGEVGFAERANVKWRKAGQRRWLGWRPTVRGVAMNPVDHPHGGGEGRTSGGRHPVNPSGKREGRTRTRGKPSDALIVRRRKSKK